MQLNSLALRGKGCGQVVVIYLSSLTSLKFALLLPQFSSAVTLPFHGNSHWQKIVLKGGKFWGK